ncbi:MAG: carboxylating nicotinate-nucleotide diphosphorylase [Myxococcales bacterium]|nr:carboxylating nicotinate-nucleotide diphosphorylase [Myxococcales bacterium]
MTLRELVRLTLDEDVGMGDVTTLATVAADARGRARLYAKQPVVVSGQAAAAEVFAQLGCAYEVTIDDGARAEPAEGEGTIAWVEGPLRGLLTGERTALNFLMRLSGVATHVSNVVARAPGLRLVDTRKTTPLLRALEKAAVRHGGGGNHRFGLFDGVMIKDNHLVAAGGIGPAVARARRSIHPLLRVEVEVETLAELEEAITAGADDVLLDNMDDTMLAAAVQLAAGRVRLEVSGGITPERLPRLLALGVDRVSMGGLIHQARWVDLSMRIQTS